MFVALELRTLILSAARLTVTTFVLAAMQEAVMTHRHQFIF